MIGITIPLKREATGFYPFISDIRHEQVKGRTVTFGKIGKQEIALLVTGHGKIRSAASTQFLIDHYPVHCVLHLGSGGAIAPQVKIGDLVIGKEIIEHDFHVKIGTRFNKKPKSFSDPKLIEKLHQFSNSNDNHLHFGRIVSGNEDIVTTERRNELLKEFNALSVDWESSGCASVCNEASIPVLVVRAMTDYAYENTNEEFAVNVSLVSHSLAQFMSEFIQSTQSFFG